MRFSLDWLRQYVDLPETPEQVASVLAGSGFPVDAVEPWGADHSLDVDVTTNRPDAMCHMGLARELAARLGRSLEMPTPAPPRGLPSAPDLASVGIQDPDLCRRYTGLVLTGVRVGPSPDWLQDRLASIGLRPINNLVDVTNFVLHECGQPLHAFDLDRLEGGRLSVRRALPGELLVTLDGIKRSLAADDLVIADAECCVALAGVMGAANSEISGATTRVLLESAHFAPTAVRRTSRRLGLRSDASHRFERGTDPGGTLWAALRAAAIMLEIAGGELAAGELDVHAGLPEPALVRLRLQPMRRLLGLEISESQARSALEALGFKASPAGAEELAVAVPTWRVDVQHEVDLIEEIGRMVGYDQVPATLPAFASTTAGAPRPGAPRDRARSFLAAAGFTETIHFPMAPLSAQLAFSWPSACQGDLVTLDNPLNRQMDTLRASLLPGLLESVALNRSRGCDDTLLFEIGRVFRESPTDGGSCPALPREAVRVAAVAGGRHRPPHWSGPAREYDFYDLKGVLEGLALRAAGDGATLRRPREEPSPPFLEPDACALVRLGQDDAGWMGRLSAEALAPWDLAPGLLAFELELPTGAEAAVAAYTPLPRHPAAERDLALLVPEEVGYSELEELVRQSGGPLLESVRPFDRYAGPPVPEGHVSLAVRLVFRGLDRTLTTAEIEQSQNQIVDRLHAEIGASLREG